MTGMKHHTIARLALLVLFSALALACEQAPTWRPECFYGTATPDGRACCNGANGSTDATECVTPDRMSRDGRRIVPACVDGARATTELFECDADGAPSCLNGAEPRCISLDP